MIEDAFPWMEMFYYVIIAACAWWAGRCDSRMRHVRTAARALWIVCKQAEERGVYFSPLHKAIINESYERLRD